MYPLRYTTEVAAKTTRVDDAASKCLVKKNRGNGCGAFVAMGEAAGGHVSAFGWGGPGMIT
jgi:hypothetical protein